MRFSINGQYWKLKFSNLIKNWGEVDWDAKTIRICRKQRSEKDRLGTIIHEVLHVMLPDHNEDAVVKMEQDLTEVLWKLGYRKQDGSKSNERGI